MVYLTIFQWQVQHFQIGGVKRVKCLKKGLKMLLHSTLHIKLQNTN